MYLIPRQNRLLIFVDPNEEVSRNLIIPNSN